jgi:hypothetical protein
MRRQAQERDDGHESDHAERDEGRREVRQLQRAAIAEREQQETCEADPETERQLARVEARLTSSASMSVKAIGLAAT